MKEEIYKKTPHFFQNLLISVFNHLAYKKRYGKEYKVYLEQFVNNRNLTRPELLEIQKNRFKVFINHSTANSKFYKELYKDINDPSNLDNISNLPIIGKETLRSNIKDVIITTNEALLIAKTGGTTGKSLEVMFRPVNTQERFAMLDNFRSQFGYELGRKTAWFSGKNILTSIDIAKNRFWKMDYFKKVRYYSTFHMKEEYLKYYVEDLIKFKPEYFVGFPSTILEIAKYGIRNGYDFPANTVKAIFPTAETITDDTRSVIEAFFKTKIYNQYASSEGAPFITECKNGNLHLELQSGVFEVLDENDKATNSGRLVVTAFATEATPLIRYDIGDTITLEDDDKVCGCGNNNPMVKEILGRIDDYIYSPAIGKINLGNVSNTLKYTKGINNFQVVQNSLESLDIYVIIDKSVYNKDYERVFIKNWRERVGEKMELNISYVDEIAVEKSGKFRIVKNNIKHLLNN